MPRKNRTHGCLKRAVSNLERDLCLLHNVKRRYNVRPDLFCSVMFCFASTFGIPIFSREGEFRNTRVMSSTRILQILPLPKHAYTHTARHPCPPHISRNVLMEQVSQLNLGLLHSSASLKHSHTSIMHDADHRSAPLQLPLLYTQALPRKPDAQIPSPRDWHIPCGSPRGCGTHPYVRFMQLPE